MDICTRCTDKYEIDIELNSVFYLCIYCIFQTLFRPIPDREYVEAYVKAYYLPATQLEVWLRDHKVHPCTLIYFSHASTHLKTLL